MQFRTSVKQLRLWIYRSQWWEFKILGVVNNHFVQDEYYAIHFSPSVPHGGPVKIMASQEHDLNFVVHLKVSYVFAFIYCWPLLTFVLIIYLLITTEKRERKSAYNYFKMKLFFWICFSLKLSCQCSGLAHF